MAVTHEEVGQAKAIAPFKFNLKPMIMGLIVLIMIFGGARWYQQWAAWDYGLDATDPMFDKYWMRVFWGEIIVEVTLFFSFVGYLWMTRDKHLNNLKPREELRRLMLWVSMLVVYAFAFYFAGSFYAEQDATWHHTVVSDTSFTLSHIFLFYIVYACLYYFRV